MKILKVKVGKDEKISIEYSRPSGNASIKSTLVCPDKARPEFYETMKRLVDYARGICEFKNETDITLPGVSFSYHGDEEILGVIFTVSRILKGSPQPLIVTTPIKYVDALNDSMGENQLLQNECEEVILMLVEECEKYVKGDRNQTQLERTGAEDLTEE